MPTYTPVLSDNFNRPDEAPIGAPWTKTGTANSNLTSGAMVGTGPSGCRVRNTASATFGGDHYAKADVTTGSGSFYLGVRMQEAEDGYSVRVTSTGGHSLYRVVAGNYTSTALASSASGWSSGATLQLDAEGTTLTSRMNGAILATATDATYSGGRPDGVWNRSVNPVDNWEAGTIGSAAASNKAGNLTGRSMLKSLVAGGLIG